MKTVNGLIERLYKDAKVKIVDIQQREQNQYKEFLKNLIVQVRTHSFNYATLIKLIKCL